MKRWVGNLVALGVGLVGGLLVLELALRLAGFGPASSTLDPLIGHRYIPHARYHWTGEGSSSGRFNAAGWRDVEHAELKPAGTTRILILGDSYVAAFQVPLDSTFFRRLERELNARARPGHRFEVIALGQNATGTTVEYLTYARWGVRYDPDVVAVLFVPNDPADDWKPVALNQSRPFYYEDGDSLRLDRSFAPLGGARAWESWIWLKSHSAAWTQVRRALSSLRDRRRPPSRPNGEIELGYYLKWNYDARLPADSIPALRLTGRILERFGRHVADDGHRFVLFVAGFPQQEDRALLAENRTNPSFDPDKTPRWLLSVGARTGFDVVSLSPDFRSASERLGRPLWFRNPAGYGHWNSTGHEVAAGAMLEYFTRTLTGFDASRGRAGPGAQAAPGTAAP